MNRLRKARQRIDRIKADLYLFLRPPQVHRALRVILPTDGGGQACRTGPDIRGRERMKFNGGVRHLVCRVGEFVTCLVERYDGNGSNRVPTNGHQQGEPV